MSRITSLRKKVLAVAAVLLIGSLATAVDASARGHGGRGGGGGGGGGHPHFSMGGGGGGGRSLGIRSGGIRSYGIRSYGIRNYGVGHSYRVGRGLRYGYGHRFHRYRGGYYPYYSGYRGCYRWRRVWTAYGWQFRRINVCYRPYPLRYLYGF